MFDYTPRALSAKVGSKCGKGRSILLSSWQNFKPPVFSVLPSSNKIAILLSFSTSRCPDLGHQHQDGAVLTLLTHLRLRSTYPRTSASGTRTCRVSFFKTSSKSRPARKPQVLAANTAIDSVQHSQQNVDTDIHGKKQKSYELYLKLLTSQHKPFNPCACLLELGTGSDGLPAELDRDPLRVDQDDVSTELVKKCLSTYIARTRRDFHTNSEARE